MHNTNAMMFSTSIFPENGRPPDRHAGGRPTASGGRPPDRGFYSCCASRKRPKGDRQIADSIRVVHPEGAHREAAGSQILFVLCIQKAPKGRPPDRRFYSFCASKKVRQYEKKVLNRSKGAFCRTTRICDL